MKTDIFKSKISNLKLLAGVQALIVFVLAFYIFLNYQNISKFKKEEKIIVVPLSMQGEFWVKDDDFSDGYFTTMMEQIEILYFDQTSSTAARNNRHLLKLVAEKSYTNIKKELKERAGLLKRYPNTVFVFKTNNEVTINRGQHTLTRRGVLIRTGINSKINQEGILFTVNYQITHGLFKITGMKYEKI